MAIFRTIKTYIVSLDFPRLTTPAISAVLPPRRLRPECHRFRVIPDELLNRRIVAADTSAGGGNVAGFCPRPSIRKILRKLFRHILIRAATTRKPFLNRPTNLDPLNEPFTRGAKTELTVSPSRLMVLEPRIYQIRGEVGRCYQHRPRPLTTIT